MVQTITPVVHGGSRMKWAVSVALHALGATVSASVLGAGLGVAGLALGAPWGRWGIALIGAVATAYAARELIGVPLPLPQLRRQVPEWWRTFFSPRMSALLYGAGLGVGFVTYLSFGTFAAVVAAAVVSGRPLLGLALVAPFGLARGLAVTVVASGRTGDAVNRVVDRLDHMAVSRVPRIANGLALGSIALEAVWTAVGTRGGDARGAAPIVLACLFAWAAILKVARFGTWRRVIEGFRFPPFVEMPARFLVPFMEGTVAVLVIAVPRAGGFLALALLLAFTASLIRARYVSGTEVPCGCFSGAKTQDYRLLLARNGGMAALALLTIITGSSPGIGGISVPHAGDLVPALLAAVGVIFAAKVLRRVGLVLRSRA